MPSFEVGDIVYIEREYAATWFDGYCGPYVVDYLDDEGWNNWYIGIKDSRTDKFFGVGIYNFIDARHYSRAPERVVRKDVFMNAVKEALKNA